MLVFRQELRVQSVDWNLLEAVEAGFFLEGVEDHFAWSCVNLVATHADEFEAAVAQY